MAVKNSSVDVYLLCKFKTVRRNVAFLLKTTIGNIKLCLNTGKNSANDLTKPLNHDSQVLFLNLSNHRFKSISTLKALTALMSSGLKCHGLLY